MPTAPPHAAISSGASSCVGIGRGRATRSRPANREYANTPQPVAAASSSGTSRHSATQPGLRATAPASAPDRAWPPPLSSVLPSMIIAGFHAKFGQPSLPAGNFAPASYRSRKRWILPVPSSADRPQVDPWVFPPIAPSHGSSAVPSPSRRPERAPRPAARRTPSGSRTVMILRADDTDSAPRCDTSASSTRTARPTHRSPWHLVGAAAGSGNSRTCGYRCRGSVHSPRNVRRVLSRWFQ